MGVRLPPRAPLIFNLLLMNCSQRIAKLPTPKFDSAVLFLLLGVSACSLCLSSTAKILAQQPFAPSQSYLGFDLNTYPGDTALSVLRKTFSFSGYWLNAPPGTKQNTWLGKRQRMLSEKLGFLILFNGPQSGELKSPTQAVSRGTADAASAISMAKKEGFPPGAIMFLDIEEGGRLPPKYHAYLRTWADAITRARESIGTGSELRVIVRRQSAAKISRVPQNLGRCSRARAL